LLLALTFSTLCWVGEGKHRLMKRSAQWNVNIVAPRPPVTLPPLIDPLYPDCPDCDGYWIPFRSGKLDIPVAEENPAEDEETAAVKSPKEKAEEGSPISEVGQEDSVNQDLCISSPCKNGGKCVATGISSVICVCQSGTSGIYCEKGGAFSGKDPCKSNPCQNGGKCSSSWKLGLYCDCQSGYGGKYCEAGGGLSGKDPCSPNPCQNGGKCSSSGNTMSCDCKSGYGGKYCEADFWYDCLGCDDFIPFRSGKLDIPVPKENPAEDEVTAAVKSPKEKAEEGSPISDEGQEDSSKNEDGDEGKDPCNSNPCQNGGNCFSKGDDILCVCKSGYGGKYCEAEGGFSGKDPCSAKPCKNGGNCFSKGDDILCVCKSGYGGKYCEAAGALSVGAKEESASKSPEGDTEADSAGAPTAGAKENSASKSSKGDTAADSAGAPSGVAKVFRSHLDVLPPIPTLSPTTTTSKSGPVKVQVKVHASDK